MNAGMVTQGSSFLATLGWMIAIPLGLSGSRPVIHGSRSPSLRESAVADYKSAKQQSATLRYKTGALKRMPTWKSATRQAWKPALQALRASAFLGHCVHIPPWL